MMAYAPSSTVDLGGGRGWLTAASAASIHRIDRRIGHLLQITEAGRSWAQQDAHWQRYLRYLAGGPWAPIALNPNTPSLHQKGDAVDSNEAQRILSIMEDHGWRRTVYRWVNGVWTLVEAWHFEHFDHLDNHRFEGAPAGAEGEIDMPLNAADKGIIKDAIFEFVRDTGSFIKGDGTSAYKFVSDAVWGQPIQAQDAHGNGIVDEHGNPVRYAAFGYLASINAQIGALSAVVKDLALAQGVDPDQLLAVIEAAAERGARDALGKLVLVSQAAADTAE